MIGNRGLQNSATIAAAAEEGSAENRLPEEDKKPLQYGKYNTFTLVCFDVTGADMDNLCGDITKYCTDP